MYLEALLLQGLESALGWYFPSIHTPYPVCTSVERWLLISDVEHFLKLQMPDLNSRASTARPLPSANVCIRSNIPANSCWGALWAELLGNKPGFGQGFPIFLHFMPHLNRSSTSLLLSTLSGRRNQAHDFCTPLLRRCTVWCLRGHVRIWLVDD